MPPPSSKRKEAPSEPFKRALGLAVRAIAGDGDVQVAYGPGRPELEGKNVHLPEPSRIPTQREIAVVRGWADSLALTAACHDQKLHNRLAPPAGQARQVFEAGERARVEALGANRMRGMAANLSAKTEDYYAHGRFANIRTRLLNELNNELAAAARSQQKAGKGQPDVAPDAIAGVLVAMLAHVSAHRLGFEFWGVRTDDLRATMARIVYWSVTGQKPAT